MTITFHTRRLLPEVPSIIQEPAVDWDLRVVQGINQLFRDITEPAGLVAMGCGSTAFRGGKLFAQWGLFPGAGWGTRIGTSLFGMATEALAFTEVEHIASKVSGQGHEITGNSWLQQYGTNAWLLGSMRATGLASQALGHWVHGENLLQSRVLAPIYQQAGMYAGILVGHGLSGNFESPADHLIRSLGFLLQFNLAGHLAQRTVGRFFEPVERVMEARSREMEIGDSEWEARDLVYSGASAKASTAEGMGESGIQVFQIRKWELPRILPSRNIHPTVMGIASTPSGQALAEFSATVRLSQEGEIRELAPNRQVIENRVTEDEWLSQFLNAHEISSHPFDLKMFRAGFLLGQNNHDLVRRMAWDVDELQLHWSLNPIDLFRGLFRGGRDAPFQNTPQEILDYQPFQAHSEVSLPLSQRLWFNGLQRLLPSRMRQMIQFHPGGRAFLLGMRSFAPRPLSLVTTGPAGRLLILVNEDPALKQIFFGKLPTETVMIEEIRAAPNIYTREDLVKALRIIAGGEENLLKDPWVQDYIQKIKENPKQAHKLKHPALAKILQKNSFDILVDDSDSTYRMLRDVQGFTALKPASARPNLTLNMALGSRRRYLERMANGFFEELSRILQNKKQYSREIPAGELPKDYPLQRFAIEVPWARYRHEFALPGAELEHLSKKIARMVLPESKPDTAAYGIDNTGFRFMEPGRRVVVLGDNGFGRTYQLAKEGHYPLFIDWDPEILRESQNIFRRVHEREIQSGKFNRQVLARWIEADWYKTCAHAHSVEVFYPFSMAHLIGMPDRYVTDFVKDFMENALHSKLRPEGGSVYLVTEVTSLIKKMKEIVEQDPSLKLVDMELHEDELPPIQGGHGFLMKPGEERTSWILYEKKPR